MTKSSEPTHPRPARQSSSRIVPRQRSRYATIPIWPATLEEDSLRAKMRYAFEANDPGSALSFSELLLRCRPGDVEAHETGLRSRVALEEMFVEWLGGWTRRPRLVLQAGLLPILDLELGEAAVVENINGRATVQDLAHAVSLPPLEVLRLLFALAHGGAIVFD